MNFSKEEKGAILIVDDTPITLEVLSEYLEEAGFKLTMALNGESALEKVQQSKPDIILLDVMMPGLDGFETCRRLKSRADTKDIPVIFMTALSQTSDKLKAFEAGAVDYITKPFDYREVSARIDTHLTIQQLQAKLRAQNVQLEQEIAQRQAIEDALRQSQARYEAIVEDQAEMVSRWLPDGTLTFVNGSYCRFLNKSRHELIGSNFLETLPAADRQEEAARLKSMNPLNIVSTYEHRMLTPQGEVRWVQWSNRAILDTQGRLVEFQSVGRDVTERKEMYLALQKARDELEQRVNERTAELVSANAQLQAEIHERSQTEQALRQSEAQLQYQANLLQNVSDAVIATDLDFNIQSWNYAAEVIYGWSAGEAMGKSTNELLTTEFLADDRELVTARFLETGTWQGEVIQKNKAGADLFIFSSVSFIKDDDGNPSGVVAVNRDITFRKQAEQSLQRQTERLRVLHEIDQAILTAQSQEAIARAVLHNILQLIPCQQASVALFNFETNQADLHTVSKNPRSHFATRKQVSLAAFGNMANLQQGKTLIITDIQARKTPSTVEKWLIDEGLRAMVTIPFVARGELLGSLNLASDKPDALPAEQLDIAEELANLLTVAIMQNQLFKAEARRRQEAEALSDIATAVNSTLNLEEVLAQILANVGRVVEHNAANMILVESNTPYPVESEPDVEFAEIAQKLFAMIYQIPHLNKMASQGQPLIISHTQHAPFDFLDWQWVQSYVGVPILLEQKVTGFLNLASQTPHFYTEVMSKRLRAFADQAAIAIQNAHLHTQTQRHARELAILNKAGQTLTAVLDLEFILNHTMAEANALVGAEGTAILLYNQTKSKLIFVAAASPSADDLLGLEVPLGSSIAGRVAETGQSVLVAEAQKSPHFYRHVDALTGLVTRSILAVPLLTRKEVIGVIEATNKRDGVFTNHDIELLEALASSAAIAIENARLFERIDMGQEQLRQLANKVISAQEEERQRLSQELHDEAGQALVALKMRLTLLQMDLPAGSESIKEQLAEAITLTEDTMHRLRATAKALRPPALDAAGLNPTLEGLCREFAGWAKLPVNYQGADIKALSDTAKISLYRFLQEALTNVAKHAQASQILVKLEVNHNAVRLKVQDDGRGFDKDVILGMKGKPQGIGLLGMRERLELLNGWLEIETAPGRGASLIAYIPLKGD